MSIESDERDERLCAWWDSAAVLADEAERLGVVPHLVATLQRRCRVHADPYGGAHYRGWCAECGWVRGGDPFADLLVPTPPAGPPDER